MELFALTLKEAARLCGRSPRTIQDWCTRGIWKKGEQYAQPKGRDRFYLREGILRWILANAKAETKSEPVPVQTHPHSPVNTAAFPGVAKALEREWVA